MSFIDILFKWQTFIGAILGGLFALAAALVVALTVRRRENVASGMVVVGTLVSVRITFEELNNTATKQKIHEKKLPLWLAEKLLIIHPKLPAFFESSVVNLSPINAYLAAHLSLFLTIYSHIQIELQRLAEDLAHFHAHGKPLRPREQMAAECKLITQDFRMAVEHSKCAVDLISKLVLQRHFFIDKDDEFMYSLDRGV